MKIETEKGSVEIQVYQKDEQWIMTHTSLKRAIYHQLKDKPKVYIHAIPGFEYPVVECRIEYDGQIFSSLSGAKPETLLNDIARNHDIEIAENRAFDRAALDLLGLQGKFYTNEMIPSVDFQIDAEGMISKVTSSNVESGVISSVEESTEKENEQTLHSLNTEANDTAAIPTEAHNKTNPDELMNKLKSYAFKAGKFKGKSLGEILDTNSGQRYLSWLEDKEDGNEDLQKDRSVYLQYKKLSA